MGGDPVIVANELKKGGAEIFCIGITGSVETKSLHAIASKNTDSNMKTSNVFILENYATLSWLVQEIINGTIDYSQCGIGKENLEHINNAMRIVDGSKSTEPWPWMAAIYLTRDQSKVLYTNLICGGSIINNYFILTAAHCLYNKKNEKVGKNTLHIKLGLVTLENITGVQDFGVSKMFIHPEFRSGKNINYDIALLMLDKSIVYKPFVRPICLPPKDLPEGSPLYRPGEFAWVSGFGYDDIVPQGGSFHPPVKHLKQLHLPLNSWKDCKDNLLNDRIYFSLFTELMFCAGEGKKGNDTCKGDSGGPFVQAQMNSDGYIFWTQIGIVTWGIGCGLRDKYSIFFNVQKLRPWIDSIVDEGMKSIE